MNGWVFKTNDFFMVSNIIRISSNLIIPSAELKACPALFKTIMKTKKSHPVVLEHKAPCSMTERGSGTVIIVLAILISPNSPYSLTHSLEYISSLMQINHARITTVPYSLCEDRLKKPEMRWFVIYIQ